MKTTIIGILTILGAVCNAALSFMKTGTADWQASIAAVIIGIGFIKAADAKPA